MLPTVKSQEESRGSERHKIDAFVKVTEGSDREYVFRTRDLSDVGLFLYTKVTHLYPLEVGSRLQLELYDYDQHITCTIVVARVVEPGSNESDDFPSGFGVKIVDMDPENRARLKTMVSRLEGGIAPY